MPIFILELNKTIVASIEAETLAEATKIAEEDGHGDLADSWHRAEPTVELLDTED